MKEINYKEDKAVRKPAWMKAQFPRGRNYSIVKNLISENNLHTICSSGNCPNKGECWSAGTATFMILGNICTRNCSFCYVNSARPKAVDETEPGKIAGIIKLLKLKHCVITSVNRDDLPDQGARIWAKTIRKIKRGNPSITMETLIPDFQGDESLIQMIIDEKPEIISHNIETVERLTPGIRSRASYTLSLRVLKYIAENGIIAKSGIMLGLGEKEEEVQEAMNDVRNAGVKIFTIGQYLQPSPDHVKVKSYVNPEVFERFRYIGLQMGYSHVESGPLIRSSYHSEKHINRI